MARARCGHRLGCSVLPSALALAALLLPDPTCLAQPPDPLERAKLVVLSDPQGATIRLGGEPEPRSAPDTLLLGPGPVTLEASLQGFETLTHEADLAPGSETLLRFVLIPEPPGTPVPEEIGLSYEVVLPLRQEAEAEAVRKRYQSLAEIFMIFPLSQGLVGKIAFREDSSFPSDELLASGLALVSLSALASRYFHGRRLEDVRRANESISTANLRAEAHNQEVDQALEAWREHAIEDWQALTKDRGWVRTEVVRPGRSGGS